MSTGPVEKIEGAWEARSGTSRWDRGHVVLLVSTLLAWGHLLDELLSITFPPDELTRVAVFVAVNAAALVVYPRLGPAKGPLLIVFGVGWIAASTLFHLVDLAAGRGSVGDASGIAEFAAGLLATAQGAGLVRSEIRARATREGNA